MNYRLIELKELTVELCFSIIKENHNKYFKTKELAEEILVNEYNIPFLDLKYNDNINLSVLRGQMSKKLIPILLKLKEKGFIEKHSKKFWKIKK